MGRPRPTDAAIALANANRVLRVQCWCGCQTVNVTASLVRAGVTVSCGRRMCNAIEYTSALVAGGEPCDCKDRAS